MNRQRFLILLLILWLATPFIQAKKIFEFQDSFRVPFIFFDDDRFYIWDRDLMKLQAYSLPDFKEKIEFGKRGLGPGEFHYLVGATISDNSVCATCSKKVLYFSKEGKLKKELKVPVITNWIFPIGKNFYGSEYIHTGRDSEVDEMAYHFYNSKMRKRADVFRVRITRHIIKGGKKDKVQYMRIPTIERVYKNRLYIGFAVKGFYIAVFDENGDKLYEIKREHQPRKFTQEDKQREMAIWSSFFGEDGLKKRMSRVEYSYPEYYPAFTNFGIDDDKIYIFPAPGIKTQEIIILDLKGNLLRKKTIPLPTTKMMIIVRVGFFSIHKGHFYYIEENEESENWELHAVPIE